MSRDPNQEEPTQLTDITTITKGVTDLDNAYRFRDYAGNVVRYCPNYDQWFSWNQKIWESCTKEQIFPVFRALAAEYEASIAVLTCSDKKAAHTKNCQRLQSYKSMRETLTIVSGLPGIVVHPNQLNDSKNTITVANGTLNLDTQKLIDNDPELLYTKCSPIEYKPNATCDTFMRFLRTAVPSSDERRWLQKYFGSALSAYTDSQRFLILQGLGGTGKGTLTKIVSHVLGDFAYTAPADLLLKNRGDKHPDALAKIHGYRFVVFSETNRGNRLNEAFMKLIVGQDTITARHIRGANFEFDPVCKPILLTNNKPVFDFTDTGMWRRLAVIEMNSVPQERDPLLFDKLKAESSGILNWMLEGYRLWLDDRLLVLTESMDKTLETYKNSISSVDLFLDRMCKKGRNESVDLGKLYSHFTSCANANAANSVSKNQFRDHLKSLGFQIRAKDVDDIRDNRYEVVIGIGIRTS